MLYITHLLLINSEELSFFPFFVEFCILYKFSYDNACLSLFCFHPPQKTVLSVSQYSLCTYSSLVSISLEVDFKYDDYCLSRSSWIYHDIACLSDVRILNDIAGLSKL